MAFRGRLFGRGLLTAALLGFVAAGSLPAAPAAADPDQDAQPAAGMGIDSLMDRLFHLVKRSYAEIATIDARLLNAPNTTAHEAAAAELAEKIAAFEERSKRIGNRLPEVEASTPSMNREIADYSRNLREMDSRVKEITQRHDLDARVADLRMARQGEHGLADEREDGQPTAGSRGDRSGQSAAESWENPREGAPARRGSGIRKSRIVAEEGAVAVGSDGRAAMTEALRRIRGPRPAEPGPNPAGDGEAKRGTGMPAIADSNLVPDRIVPVALEVKDSNDRPVPRRRVEFVIDSPKDAPISAFLLDGSSGVQANSLLELTDDQGLAKVEMRLTGEDRKVRIQRTVTTYPDRTVCKMKLVIL